MTMLNKVQLTTLRDAAKVFQKFETVYVRHWDYYTEDKVLEVDYLLNYESLCVIELSFEDIIRAIQFDPSVNSFDAFTIKDDEGRKYDSYESYFDTCPKALIEDFVCITLAYRTLSEKNIFPFNIKKAA
jgi:beta-xylosidase